MNAARRGFMKVFVGLAGLLVGYAPKRTTAAPVGLPRQGEPFLHPIIKRPLVLTWEGVKRYMACCGATNARPWLGMPPGYWCFSGLQWTWHVYGQGVFYQCEAQITKAGPYRFMVYNPDGTTISTSIGAEPKRVDFSAFFGDEPIPDDTEFPLADGCHLTNKKFHTCRQPFGQSAEEQESGPA